MPFNRPLLADLITRIQGDIAARLPGTDPTLRRSVLEVLSQVNAATAHGLYGFIQDVAKQIIPDTADAEFLERWASLFSVTRKPATQAAGSVDFTGTDGSVIPVGTSLQRADATAYTTDAAVTIAGGVATVAVTAEVAGQNGNAASASGLSLIVPITGVASSATVAAGGIAGGTDLEDDTALRGRLLARIQQPPHGGTAADYEAWALAAPGVNATRAWAIPLHSGPGTVGLLFAVDDDATGPIPTPADVTAVQSYVDPLRPVTATVTAIAPTAVPINFGITLLIEPGADLATVQAAITTELTDLVKRVGEPGATLYRSQISEAISRAAGELTHTLTTPAADTVLTATDLATMGTITWA